MIILNKFFTEDRSQQRRVGLAIFALLLLASMTACGSKAVMAVTGETAAAGNGLLLEDSIGEEILPVDTAHNDEADLSIELANTYGTVPRGAVARLGNGQLVDVALSPDGQYLAAASSIGLFLYRADTLEQLWFSQTDAASYSLSWSPDGQKLITGAAKGRIYLWKASNGRRLRTLTRNSPYDTTLVAWSPDGKRVASVAGRLFTIWKASNWRVEREYDGSFSGSRWSIDAMAWSPDSQNIATVHYEDAGALIWDVASLTSRFVYGGLDNMESVAWSPDGMRLAAGSWVADETTVWDAPSGTLLQKLGGAGAGVAWSPDGGTIAATSTAQQKLILWNAADGAQVRVQELPFQWWKPGVSWSPAGSTILTWSREEFILWDVASGVQGAALGGFYAGGMNMAWSPNGQTIISASDTALILWDVAAAQSSRYYQPLPLDINQYHRDGIAALALSPDGQILATSTMFTSQITLWSASSMAVVRTLDAGASIRGLAWSPDGQRLAAGSEVSVGMWDTATWAKAWEANHVYGPIVWSPDGQKIAARRFYPGDEAVVLSAADGTELLSLKLPAAPGAYVSVDALSWSPDGQKLAVGGLSSASVVIWDAASGHTIRTIKSTGGISSLAWSPDGKKLAAGLPGGKIALWNAKTGARLKTLTGHNNSVVRLAWSPDGRLLAAAEVNGSIIVWKP